MSELKKAIEEITYVSKKFPNKAWEIVVANKEEAIPYLRSAIEKALEEKEDLEEDYQLHFYALFLLGEFQDREFFSKIMEIALLPSEVLDCLIGDLTTDGFRDIVYHTYNGDIELLKSTILNKSVNEFVRAELLEVMGQLYLDGTLEENEWKTFLKQRVYSGEEYSYFYDGVAGIICKCHFVDMLPEIRYMLDNELMDETVLGWYDSCLDYMFEYREYEKNFCKDSINAAETLKRWAMFEQDSQSNLMDEKARRKEFEKLMKMMKGKNIVHKVGRNDPCPCGSGKKYKFCCLNKPNSPLDAIESALEREKCLSGYPYTGEEQEEGKVYLKDYFDLESIEIDKLLYLALKNRTGFIWDRNECKEKNRCREYLSLAFPMFLDKVKKEGIKTFEEYNKKFSIHYFCEEWIGELLELLKESGNKALYTEVKKCEKEMKN